MPAGTESQASTSAGLSAAPMAKKKAPGSARKRKIDNSQPACAADPNWEQVLSIPVHRVVFMAKCEYFSVLLRTALGDSSTAVIKEYAGSREEVQAIMAAAECVYTGKIPLQHTTEVEYDGDDCIEITSRMQKHIMELLVR